MIARTAQQTLKRLAKGFPVVVVTGPRQSGKSTLVKETFAQKPYVTFDELDVLELAKSDPRGFLAKYPDGAVIDEAQKFPDLFSYIKKRVDDTDRMGEFVLTGSQQFSLMTYISDSLAGRAGFVQLLPLSAEELRGACVCPRHLDELLFSGSYPALYNRKVSSAHWFSGYVTTYLERDVRSILNVKDLGLFQRFLRLCAARCGQLLNVSSLANDCGISKQTADGWLSVLEASYIVCRLNPYFSNFGKRLIKSPKLYFYDTGIVAWLMNIQDAAHLSIHPMRGALFENFVMLELLKQRLNAGLSADLYFWRDNLGDEIDIVIEHGDVAVPVEVKSSATVTADHFRTLRKWRAITKQDQRAFLVYAGSEAHDVNDTYVIPWDSLLDIRKRLKR